MLHKTRPDLPPVQRKLDGSIVLGPSASLSDAMPFLTQEGSATARLVASYNDDGSITMAWQRTKLLQPGTDERRRARGAQTVDHANPRA